MGTLRAELFIASRIGSRSATGGGVMVRIAVATAAVSMAVMILSLAVIAGFRQELTGRMCAFSAHVRILNMDSSNELETRPVKLDRALESAVAEVPGFRDITPYAVKGGIIRTDDAMQGVMLKGVDASYNLDFFRSSLIDGQLPQLDDSLRRKQLLISQSVASALRLATGDVVQMLFLQEGLAPRRDRFIVCGIYSTGLEEMDRMVALTELASVQRLCGWDASMISGYEVNTSDFGALDRFADRVTDAVSAFSTPEMPLAVLDVKSSYPALFDWLGAHRVNAAVIITVMLVVALFGMISALLIILLERTRMIGLLKALGMKNGAVQRIFLLLAGRILLPGLLAGDALGLAMALLQKYTHIVKLDQSGYFLAWVPVDINPWAVLALNIGALLFIVALLSLPVRVIARIKPDTTLRYQ